MCPPMRAALGVALTIEGVAATPAEALALADAGEIALRPTTTAAASARCRAS